ncbi:MAG: hypothetical protein ACIAS6_08745 [Phycisphaerales bacterium JB060]
MRTKKLSLYAAWVPLVGLMVVAGGCDRGGQATAPAQQPADASEAASKPDAAGDIRAAYHAVLDAAIGAQDDVVAEHGREPWGAAGVLRHPDFDAPAAGPLIDEQGLEREGFVAEVAITRTAAAALRTAGVVEKLAELTRAVGALDGDTELDLSGTLDARARDAYRMLACLAVDAEVNGIGAPSGRDDYATVIAGLDAMARAQLQAGGEDATTSNLVLLRFTDSLVLDAIAAGHMTRDRARALLGSARVATDALRQRYLEALPPGLLPESRPAMAGFWHATRDARRLALAIEVHRREHGALPAALDALVPGVLAEMPRDPHAEDGRYVYRRDETNPFAYVLYSVGPDGVDDGGVRTRRTFSPEPGTDLVLVPEG